MYKVTTTRPSALGIIQWLVRVLLMTSATGIFFAGSVYLTPQESTAKTFLGCFSGMLGLISLSWTISVAEESAENVIITEEK